jgi:flavodoxin
MTKDTKAKANKILVAYFSHSGNTRAAAGQVKDITGGDVFEITAAEAYPGDYDATVARAVKELKAKARPQLKSEAPDLSAYTTIILGYPNWCNTIPMPVAAFLSVNDLSGKNIAPFCTNEGSGLGRSEADIKALCPQSKVLPGLALRGSTVKKSRPEMARWLKELGLGST